MIYASIRDVEGYLMVTTSCSPGDLGRWGVVLENVNIVCERERIIVTGDLLSYDEVLCNCFHRGKAKVSWEKFNELRESHRNIGEYEKLKKNKGVLIDATFYWRKETRPVKYTSNNYILKELK